MMIIAVTQEIPSQPGIIGYIYYFLVSATGLALMTGGVKAFRKIYSGASMRAKDVYQQMQDQRDEALDELELVKAERDQGYRMVNRRDRIIQINLGDEFLKDIDGSDYPSKPPPRQPRRVPRKKQSNDPSE